MNKGVISTIFGIGIFGAILACSILGLAIMGNAAGKWQGQKSQVAIAESQAEIAHEERLRVEAEIQPEIIAEQWQGATTHLLVSGQLEADRDMRRALIRLALADLNEREQWRGFGQGMAAVIILSSIGALWWQTARRVVQ